MMIQTESNLQVGGECDVIQETVNQNVAKLLENVNKTNGSDQQVNSKNNIYGIHLNPMSESNCDSKAVEDYLISSHATDSITQPIQCVYVIPAPINESNTALQPININVPLLNECSTSKSTQDINVPPTSTSDDWAPIEDIDLSPVKEKKSNEKKSASKTIGYKYTPFNEELTSLRNMDNYDFSFANYYQDLELSNEEKSIVYHINPGNKVLQTIKYIYVPHTNCESTNDETNKEKKVETIYKKLRLVAPYGTKELVGIIEEIENYSDEYIDEEVEKSEDSSLQDDTNCHDDIIIASFCQKCNINYAENRLSQECDICHEKLLYQCKKCSKVYSIFKYMYEHTKRNNCKCKVKGYFMHCILCEYKTAIPADLIKHYDNMHCTEKPKKKVFCNVCGRGYKLNSSLLRHLREGKCTELEKTTSTTDDVVDQNDCTDNGMKQLQNVCQNGLESNVHSSMIDITELNSIAKRLEIDQPIVNNYS